MERNQDSDNIVICETKLMVSAYIIGDERVAIEQEGFLGEDPDIVVIDKSDITALIRALQKLKKELQA